MGFAFREFLEGSFLLVNLLCFVSFGGRGPGEDYFLFLGGSQVLRLDVPQVLQLDGHLWFGRALNCVLVVVVGLFGEHSESSVLD